MNIHFKLLLNCATVLVILFASDIMAKPKGKWTTLFDGKSTNAWRCYKQDSFPTKSWIIENGALKTIAGGERCDIITKEKYRNFELEAEWRVSPGGNSGILYHVAEGPEQVWHTGPEMQVLDDDKHRDGQNPKTSAGSLYALIAPTNKLLRPVGEFNKSRIIVHGQHVEHWLNNQKVVEYELGSDTLKKLIAESKFKDLAGFAQQGEGHIALQHHGDEVWFRKIRVRRLDDK